MISLSKIYYDFLKYNNSSELLELHSIPYNNFDSIPNKFLTVLENYLEDNELNREQLRILTSMEIEHVSVLMAVANYIRRRKRVI